MAFMARLRITAGESLTRIANRIYVAAAARAAELEARHRQFGGQRGSSRRKRRVGFSPPPPPGGGGWAPPPGQGPPRPCFFLAPAPAGGTAPARGTPPLPT